MTLAGIHFKDGSRSGYSGGALYILSALVSVQGCKLSSNQATYYGGAIFAGNVGTTIDLYTTIFVNNTASLGKDIYVSDSANVIVQSTCPPGWFGEPVAGSMLDTSTTGGGTISGNLTSFDDG